MSHTAGQSADGLHFLSLQILRLKFEMFGDVPFDSDKVDDFFLGIKDRGNGCLFRIQGAIALFIDQAARPDATIGNGCPEFAVEGIVVQAAFENAWVSPENVFKRVTGHFFKGRVSILDIPLRIGDNNNFAGVFYRHLQSFKISLILLALGYVAGNGDDMGRIM